MDKIDSFSDLNDAKGFKLAHLNIRSLVKKVDQIRLLLNDSDIDLLSISETWLKGHLHTGLVELKGFLTFRQDRGPRGKKRGGGLITYVNKKYSDCSESLADLNVSNENIEAQWVMIHRAHCKDIISCNIYRPPTGDLKKAILYLEECLLTLNLSKINLFVMGDMNVDYKNKSAPNFKKLNFFFKSNGLEQHVLQTTRNNERTKSLLDLAVSNSNFVSTAGVLNHFISDHQPIYILHKKGRDTRKSVGFRGRSYRNFDGEAFRIELLKRDWESYYDIESPDQAWDHIKTNILSVLDEMCPLRSYQIKNYRPDWMTKELIEQIKDRDYFYKKAKTTGEEDYWNIARYFRNITNSNIRQARREFILTELRENEGNAKKFWKVIRGVIPSDKKLDDNNILLKDHGVQLDKKDVASFINDFFVNVGNFHHPVDPVDPLADDSLDTGGSSSSSSSEISRSEEEADLPKRLEKVRDIDVHRIVRDINVSKSSGLDNISSRIIKEAFLALIPEVTFMMNLSIMSSVFPAAWKEALVIPIPKSGNLSQVKNYRLISLLPLPGKILEKLIHGQLSHYLESSGLLSTSQHGFRREHSTVHSIAQLTNFTNTKMDSKVPTLATYIDFRKAFDCVQHPVLLQKLSSLRLDRSTIEWVGSYLLDRKQRVYANNVYSSFLPITQGVPQGSVLGPLFYIIYANDLVKTFQNCNVAMYADDTMLYTANPNFDISVGKMQGDINSLAKWCKANGIAVNTEKSKLMVFGSTNVIGNLPQFEITFLNEPMQMVSSYKYLGITLDSQLTYNLHVNKMVSLAAGKIKQFQRMRSFLTVHAATLVYKSMILPLLEYGDFFLSAATAINRKRLQTLQNKGLRCALNVDTWASTGDLHLQAGLLNLKYRREQHLLNFMYTWANDPRRLKYKSVSGPRTRSTKKTLLTVKRPRTEKFKKSFAYLGPVKWNHLPMEVHESHQLQDKGNYRKHVSRLMVKKAGATGNGSMAEY